jgi:hypothetical protein
VKKLTDRSTNNSRQSRRREGLQKSGPAVKIPVVDQSSPEQLLTIKQAPLHYQMGQSTVQSRASKSGIS